MQIYDVGYINFGSPDGRFIGVERLGDGSFEISESLPKPDNPAAFVLTSYRVGKQGDRQDIVSTKEENFGNTEGWYTEPIAAGKPLWSAIYQWADKPEILSISAS